MERPDPPLAAQVSDAEPVEIIERTARGNPAENHVAVVYHHVSDTTFDGGLVEFPQDDSPKKIPLDHGQ